MVGEVVSDKMDKTVVVIVKRLTRHANTERSFGASLGSRRMTKIKSAI